MAHNRPNNLRIVLIGGKQSGKTCAINTILGKKSAIETARCQKTEAVVNGLELTLIDTPGYWRDLLLCDTAEFIKHELLLSLTLCPPGPHAVILVLELDIPFTDEIRRTVQEHTELLGTDIWKHTIILFTRRRSIEADGETIQQYIEREGQALRWLVDKCERRCYSFENEDQDNDSQVTELLKKIQEMAVRVGHFEPNQDKLKEIWERRRLVTDRAMARQSRVKQQREIIQNGGDLVKLPEVRIVIVGWVFSGKSAAANTLISRDEFPTSHRTVESRTSGGEIASGQKISVTDTPGWFKYFPVHHNTSQVTSEIRKALTLVPKRPHAILLVVPLGVSFLEEQRKIMSDNMNAILGENVWRHTIVLFTWGDLLVNMSVEEHIESEGEPLRWLVEKCGNRYHVFNNKNQEDPSQVTSLVEKIEEMMKGNLLFTLSVENLHEKPQAESGLKPGLSCRHGVNVVDSLHTLEKQWMREDEEMEEFVKTELRSGSFELNLPNFANKETDSQDIDHEQSAGPCVCDLIKESLIRERSRRDCIWIKRALDYIETKGQSSECCEHEIQRARQKVLQWKTSSGYGTFCTTGQEEETSSALHECEDDELVPVSTGTELLTRENMHVNDS